MSMKLCNSDYKFLSPHLLTSIQYSNTSKSLQLESYLVVFLCISILISAVRYCPTCSFTIQVIGGWGGLFYCVFVCFCFVLFSVYSLATIFPGRAGLLFALRN